ncbi:hypothetical protein HKW98_06900 [Stutzerimonas urumqiensis]|uniref:hypothetical protein n=1 Tax=Stutzerimonas urumqiensis TaxID=638269 RepID=UPI003BABB207
MSTFKNTFIATALASFVAAPALAADAKQENQQAQQDPKPYSLNDDNWVGISGTVESAGAESFVLDYGDGSVVVEMDDWDWYPEGSKLLSGDQVTVFGNIDDSLFELTKIEAGAVYVKGLNSYFFASPADEEEPWHSTLVYLPTAQSLVQGTVASIDGRELKLDTGDGTLTVDTETLSYNPLDDKGYQQIEVGDRISAVGAMDAEFFGDREFKAQAITTLSEDTDEQTG